MTLQYEVFLRVEGYGITVSMDRLSFADKTTELFHTHPGRPTAKKGLPSSDHRKIAGSVTTPRHATDEIDIDALPCHRLFVRDLM